MGSSPGRWRHVQAFVEARYEYHWAPLIGCLVGHFGRIGAAQPSHVIGAVTGISYQPPQDAALPSHLIEGLAALGVEAQPTHRDYPNRLQRFAARRGIRSELRADRPVTVFGVGVNAFGPAWGLIVGCDDERQAWRRDGPMTEQISPWLLESEFDASPAWILIRARKVGEAHSEGIQHVAEQSFISAVERVREDLQLRVETLQSSVELEPQRHAHEAQSLAANWGEAAQFWQEHPHEQIGPIAQKLAVTLSQYATLFPYPMGGQPNNPGVRSAAAGILVRSAESISVLH